MDGVNQGHPGPDETNSNNPTGAQPVEGSLHLPSAEGETHKQLAKQERLLDVWDANCCYPGRVEFAQRFEDGPAEGAKDPSSVVFVRYDDWLDMGKPDHITVTIEPGDRLNP